MKRRPRNAENNVATILSEWFTRHNLSTVERIPVIGRRGPDITWNELGWVVDVKSRKSNPKWVRNMSLEPFVAGRLFFSRLGSLFEPESRYLRSGDKYPMATITKYYRHLENWRIENIGRLPYGGKTVIVLHYPGSNYMNSVLIMKTKDFKHSLEIISGNHSS